MKDFNDDQDRLHKKRNFYNAFELLEKSDEESQTAVETAAFAVRRKGSTFAKQHVIPSSERTGEETSQDAGTRMKPASGDRAASKKDLVIGSTPVDNEPPPSAIPRTTAKHKGKSAIKLVPDAQRLFRGLQFFFFPNNDTNAARRMRITKALEYGASWQKDFNRFVTHVIVDVDLSYNDLLQSLNLSAVPSNVTVVSEIWPAECLSYRAILDPTLITYRVRGAPIIGISGEVSKQDNGTEVSAQHSSSDTSLVLKPAGKAVRARESSTPTTTSESGPPSLNESTTAVQNGEAEQSTELLSALPQEFRDIIEQARGYSALPLDDEESDGRPGSSAGTDVANTSIASAANQDMTSEKKVLDYADRFQCMQAHTGDGESGPNAETVKILQQMADHYAQTRDEWRSRSYRKAIATLRNYPEKITTKEQALALPNVGDRLADKIEEIAFTHRLRRLDNAKNEGSDHVLQLFLRIYGAGFVQASAWVRKGHKTLDDLLNKARLTTNQRIGIEHIEDFSLRIPRAEVKQHGDVVLTALRQVDPAFSVIVGGSYRRGSPTSGDIDCVITHPALDSDQMRLLVIDKIIAPLTKQGFIKAELSVISREDGSKWHGASCLPGSTVWRRLDLLLVPAEEFGAAMIYFTGNDIFNRSLRLLASKKGLRLNQHGLYKDVIRGEKRERITQGTLMEGRDERRIFEILGVPWREPWERLI